MTSLRRLAHNNTATRNGGSGAGRNEAVLDRASFTVLPGQQVALLGATDSGRTTLVNLLSCFSDVTGGRVLVDDVAAR